MTQVDDSRPGCMGGARPEDARSPMEMAYEGTGLRADRSRECQFRVSLCQNGTVRNAPGPDLVRYPSNVS